ncbi:MAG: ADP-forming succinate--CoA ligase subunit beta [Chitinophagales bacterium]|jgi:succinyl-CoA synthetase beta subunit|nr:ADP-forming succinate--CoA ligase subunit beta [Sphingobacteriales bacterium]MBP7533880.1 ADP-forming succinate--CoA ligase subunit beta [Chitinophagales bacterium]
MNLHEYQAKELLNRYGITVQRGKLAYSADEAVTAAQQIQAETGSGWVVVKAQVHAGGRGKGGGVKLAKNLDEVREKAGAIIGMHLITPQTSAEGKLVRKVLITEDMYVPGPSEIKEYYMSVLLDRAKGCNVIVYSTEGGMDIEHVAETTPHLVHKEWIDPIIGLQPFQARRIAFNLGLTGDAYKSALTFIPQLYNTYIGVDATLIEINPLLKTSDNRMVAVDGKMSIDESALFRHKDVAAWRDFDEEDPTEVEADKFNLNYVKLDGNVGCMVNGAGLAMATMDIIKLAGGSPANFLDVGGKANAETVEAGFRIILKDPNVRAILINIFGGIVRCDRIANGVVEAYKKMGDEIKVPIIVRLQGTNAEIAKQIIDESGLQVQSAILLKEAAEKVANVFKV